MRDTRISFFASFITTVLMCMAISANAQQNDFWFEQVLNTGAYNMGIIQDREGFLWLTTTGGLIRFDGYQQRIFTEGPKELTSNFVPCVFEDTEGLLWIATLSGLDLYDKNDGSIRHFQPQPGKTDSIGSNRFNWAPKLITEDPNGGIWIASRDGIFRYDKKPAAFKSFRNDPNNPNTLGNNDVWTIITDRDGKIWIGTATGLDVYDTQTDSFTHYRHDPDKPGTLGKGIVYAVFQDSDGDIWAGTSEGGLNRFQPKSNTFLAYTHNPADPKSIAHREVFSITEDSKGNLWLGRSFSSSIGLEQFNKKTGKFLLYTHNSKEPGSLSGNIVLTCYEDRSGILWVPENTGPVNKHDPYSHRFSLYTTDQGIPETKYLSGLTSVLEDSRGDIWFGGQKGLTRLDHKTRQWQSFGIDQESPQAFWNTYAFSVIEGSRGDFWVATDDGYLNLFDREKGIVLKRYLNPFVQNTAREIIEDRSNPDILWFGVEGYGLFNFDKSSERFTHFKSDPDNPEALGNDYVYALLQDKDNILWVQTQGGLNRFDPANGLFSRYTHDPANPQSISSNVVNDIFIDDKGTFWVSTDRGLNKFNPISGLFDSFGGKNGFTTPIIRAIVKDEAGQLWLGSNNGLFVFDPVQEKVVGHYTTGDGLQGDSFSLYGCSAIKAGNGEIWFVGLNGVNSFFPEKLHHNSNPPQAYLLNLFQGGEELVPPLKISATKEIFLSWRHNYFEFEYVGLNFSQPQKNQYRYKLEGWDNDWYFAGSKRFGRYSGLSGGNYSLKVFASNNDGVWSTSPAILTVHVENPFWKTWWFYSFVVFICSGLFAIFYSIRIHQLKKFNKELEQLVQERTKEYQEINANLKQEIRKREQVEEELLRSKKLESIGVLAGGIAHDFNNLMTVVMGNINLAQLKPEMNDSKELESAVQALRRAKELTQKFITFSSGGDPIKHIVDIEEVTRSAVDLALSGSNIQAVFSIAPDLLKVNIDRGYISQAMFNIIDNSRQAMERGGILEITIRNLHKDGKSGSTGLPIEEGDYVAIEFKDTGCGIPPEHLPKIFDPYFTTADKGAQKGKGLGLTIAYSIIKKHGGHTFIDSAVGRGTVVQLLLPAGLEPEKTEAREIAPLSPPAPSDKKKILVMDDEEMLREMASLMLAHLGYEVTLAPDGDAAVRLYQQALAEEKPFDAVILDLTIPGGVGGKEVVKSLRKLDPHLKAIVSSGYADDPVVSNYQHYGFIDSLSKPYDMAALKKILIRTILTPGTP